MLDGVLVDPNNKDKVKCKLCKKEMRGVIYRFETAFGS